MKKFLLSGIFILGLVFVFSNIAYACSTDGDCPGGYICVFGSCNIGGSGPNGSGVLNDSYNTNTTTHYTSPSQTSCESNGYTCLSPSELAQVNADSVTAYGCPSGSQCYKNISPKENSVSTTPNPAVSNPATSAVPAKNPATSTVPAIIAGEARVGGNDGLIPCGNPDQPACTLCHFIIGFQGLVAFLLKLLITVALAGIFFSGVMYVISAGDETMITSAKNFAKASVTGFVMVLGAWLIVNVAMWALSVRSDMGIEKTNWYTFNCSTTNK